METLSPDAQIVALVGIFICLGVFIWQLFKTIREQ